MNKLELTWVFKNGHVWTNTFNTMEQVSDYVWSGALIDDPNVISVYLDTNHGDRIFYKGDQK